MNKNKWYQATVIQGRKIGRDIGFPTLNLDKVDIFAGNKEGVYIVQVKLKRSKYFGLLFYGPRTTFGETEKVLEIFVFDFGKEIYGATIHFKPFEYIRGVKNFPDLDSFKKQLSADIKKAQKIIDNLSNHR